MNPVEAKTKKVLLISSSGGHWIQMLRLRSAFEVFEQHFQNFLYEKIALRNNHKKYVFVIK
jgi:hypothetical protein